MAPRPPVELTFTDNNGKTATVGAHVAQAQDRTEAGATVNALAAALAPLSSAGITNARYTWYPTGFARTSPQVGSNVYRRLILLFREGDRMGVVSVPSPRALPFDVDGPYRAIRISREALALSGVLAPLEAALAGSTLPDGTAFPATFVVGGVTELTP